LRDRQRLDELELLMHQCNPCPLGVARPLQHGFAPPNEDVARVRRLFPAKQARQCRFARAVLTDHCMNFARVEIDADITQSFDSPIGLGEPAHRDDRLGDGIVEIVHTGRRDGRGDRQMRQLLGFTPSFSRSGSGIFS
jgi:hypothetical protein